MKTDFEFPLTMGEAAALRGSSLRLEMQSFLRMVALNPIWVISLFVPSIHLATTLLTLLLLTSWVVGCLAALWYHSGSHCSIKLREAGVHVELLRRRKSVASRFIPWDSPGLLKSVLCNDFGVHLLVEKPVGHPAIPCLTIPAREFGCQSEMQATAEWIRDRIPAPLPASDKEFELSFVSTKENVPPSAYDLKLIKGLKLGAALFLISVVLFGSLSLFAPDRGGPQSYWMTSFAVACSALILLLPRRIQDDLCQSFVRSPQLWVLRFTDNGMEGQVYSPLSHPCQTAGFRCSWEKIRQVGRFQETETAFHLEIPLNPRTFVAMPCWIPFYAFATTAERDRFRRQLQDYMGWTPPPPAQATLSSLSTAGV
ncbi:hypothetical protein [Planctomicrobium sp. SH664]|uniref:hypothetical protein n=1 Tax=Planctomicrobium sp. SH664 TaxID=3448125 RepID=UPI003F5BAFF5